MQEEAASSPCKYSVLLLPLPKGARSWSSLGRNLPAAAGLRQARCLLPRLLYCGLVSLGWILIDRCGKHFGTILNYLRDGAVPLPESRREIEELLAEAKYYLVQGLVDECQAALQVGCEANRSWVALAAVKGGGEVA